MLQLTQLNSDRCTKSTQSPKVRSRQAEGCLSTAISLINLKHWQKQAFLTESRLLLTLQTTNYWGPMSARCSGV